MTSEIVLEIFCEVLLTVTPYEGHLLHSNKQNPTLCIEEQIKCITATYSNLELSIFIWLGHKMPIKGRITLK